MEKLHELSGYHTKSGITHSKQAVTALLLQYFFAVTPVTGYI